MNGRVRPKQKPAGLVFVADFRCPITGKRKQLEAPTEAAAWALVQQGLSVEAPAEAAPEAAVKGFTLRKAYELALQERWGGRPAERTCAGYALDVVQFFGAGMLLENINAMQVAAYRNDCKRRGNKAATINYKTSMLSTMRAVAAEFEMVTALPPMPRSLPISNQRDRVFSDEEVDAFYGWFSHVGHQLMADYFLFMVETGCRFSDGTRVIGRQLHLDEKNPAESWITFQVTKTGKPRTVPLTDLAIAAVKNHVPKRGTDLVWPVNYKQMNHQFNRGKAYLGIDDPQLTIHCARHTCASRMARRGVNLPQIMAWGGWTSLRSVQRYAHVDMQSLKSVRTLLN